MPRDLAQSTRGYNIFCRWWSHDEREQFELDEMIYKRTPSGAFWAKEVAPESMRGNIVGGVFMIDSSRTTIRSPDNCMGLKSEDIVEYQGELWIVVSVQKGKAKHANTMYAADKNCSHFWYIELRK